MTDALTCPQCGAIFQLRDTDQAESVYRCENNHWYMLSPLLGWLVIPEPRNPLDPTGTGV